MFENGTIGAPAFDSFWLEEGLKVGWRVIGIRRGAVEDAVNNRWEDEVGRESRVGAVSGDPEVVDLGW